MDRTCFLNVSNILVGRWRIQGRTPTPTPTPTPLTFRQTKAQRVEQKFLDTGPPLSQALDDRAATPGTVGELLTLCSQYTGYLLYRHENHTG